MGLLPPVFSIDGPSMPGKNYARHFLEGDNIQEISEWNQHYDTMKSILKQGSFWENTIACLNEERKDKKLNDWNFHSGGFTPHTRDKSHDLSSLDIFYIHLARHVMAQPEFENAFHQWLDENKEKIVDVTFSDTDDEIRNKIKSQFYQLIQSEEFKLELRIFRQITSPTDREQEEGTKKQISDLKVLHFLRRVQKNKVPNKNIIQGAIEYLVDLVVQKHFILTHSEYKLKKNISRSGLTFCSLWDPSFP